MDTQQKATPQQAARSAMLLDLIFSGRGLTDEELQRIDRPFAEWPKELVAKTQPFCRVVETEDARASAPSPGKQ